MKTETKGWITDWDISEIEHKKAEQELLKKKQTLETEIQNYFKRRNEKETP
jgi:hypothetical protein